MWGLHESNSYNYPLSHQSRGELSTPYDLVFCNSLQLHGIEEYEGYRNNPVPHLFYSIWPHSLFKPHEASTSSDSCRPNFIPPIIYYLINNWYISLFYGICKLWGTVVLTLLL